MEFTTKSQCPTSYYISLAIAWAICAAGTFFLVPHDPGSILISQGFFALLFAIMIPVFARFQRWQLDFAGDKIRLTNLGNHKQYICYDMNIADCNMKCTSLAKDRGNLFIKDTIFNIRNIENFSQMKNYIETNFH